MERHVKQQVERIIDASSERKQSVIVQMGATDPFGGVLAAQSRAVAGRRLATSARDLLPPPAADLQPRNRTDAVRRRLRGRTKSITSQLATEATPTRTRIVTAATKSLKPLLESTELKTAIARERGRSRRADHSRPMMRSFWSSSSAVLELDRDDLAKVLLAIPNVVGVYPNRLVSVPPVVKVNPSRLSQNVLDNKVSAWGVNAIGAMSVWGAYGAEGKDSHIAVLDTGVDASHPDLVGKVIGWAEFDADGAQVANSQPHDSAQHGTHVAATIAGGDASGQWIGVAPQARILGGLVLKGGSGTDAQILAGIEWAIEQNVDVINMSLGGLSFSPEVVDVYTQSFVNANLNGIVVVVSVGNEWSQTAGPPANDFFSLAVGATDHRDRTAGFSGGRTLVVTESNFIDQRNLPLIYSKPDLSAPGVAIKSAVPGGGHEIWNGTSMAAPHVSGAIAVLLDATKIGMVSASERAFLIQDLLISTVEELGEAGQDHRFGFGRVDVLRAVGYARELGYA